MYGVGFTARSLPGKEAKGGTRETGDKVSIDKELMEVGRVAEGDRVIYVSCNETFYSKRVLKISK